MSKTAIKRPERIVMANMRAGDVFSENPHYAYIELNKDGTLKFQHFESGKNVDLTEEYVQNMLVTADQYNHEVIVGREDKYWTAKQIADEIKAGTWVDNDAPREGDVRIRGIRSLFEDIHSSDVFTVCFTKQNEVLSAKKIADQRQAQLDAALLAINKAAASNKGVAKVAEEQIRMLQDNPILPIIPGEERTLRGYKVQFVSRDGKYQCVDMDIDTSKGASNERPVNINTLLWLAYKGTKYIVE